MSTTEVARSDMAEKPSARSATDPGDVEAAWFERNARLRRIGFALTPALIYLAIREFSLLILSWMTSKNQMAMGSTLTSWDGQWFLGIAEGGYGGVPPGLVDAFNRRDPDTALAFFPGYPYAVRWLAGLDGPGGIGLIAAALTVTIAFGVFCAYGLARLGRVVRGGSMRAGLILVVLFAASPMSVVLSMSYTEAMFCALAVWSLIGVLERRWVLAGVCCSLAGLVRPTAAALILAVGLAAVITVVQRKEGWRPIVGGLIAPAGIIGYLAWVGTRTGAWNGWFTLQERGWDSGFDGGKATWTFTFEALARGSSVLEVATVALIVAALTLVVVAIRRRLEWPLIVYAVGVLVMDLGANGLFNSKARLMLPAFTLLVPVAIALAKRRPSTALTVLGWFVLAGCWFGAYSVTAWSYAI